MSSSSSSYSAQALETAIANAMTREWKCITPDEKLPKNGYVIFLQLENVIAGKFRMLEPARKAIKAIHDENKATNGEIPTSMLLASYQLHTNSWGPLI